MKYTAERYPTCPWQFQDRQGPAIKLTLDGRAHVANYSAVTTDERLPAPLPPLQLSLDVIPHGGQVDPNDSRLRLLDIAKGESATIRARLSRADGRPVSGTTISFTSTNGALVGGTAGAVKTDANGEAAVRLTPHGARLTNDGYGEVLVTAGVGSLREHVSSERLATSSAGTTTRRTLLKWIDSSPITLEVEHDVLVSAPASGFTAVETLEDRGETRARELAGSGAQEGDGILLVPFFTETQVRVRTAYPSHDLHVEVVGPAGPVHGGGGGTGAVAELSFPFETLNSGRTPSADGSHSARVTGNATLVQDSREGAKSLRLPGGGADLRVPDAPATRANGGLEVGFWMKPERLGPATLIARPGTYELDLRADGRLHLRVSGSAAAGPPSVVTATSARAVGIGEWTYVEVRLSEVSVSLAIGPAPDRLDVVTASNAPGSFAGSSAPSRVGRQFTGLLDDLTFRKRAINPPGLTLAAAPGTSPAHGLQADGSVRTNANGEAVFTVRAGALPNPDDWRPVSFQIRVHGSGEAVATVHVAHETVWGHLVGIGKAFLMGPESVGESESWFKKAAAWAGSILPVVASVRDLAFEAYKAATGCDSVSWMNVTFGVVGLVADVFTFGAAGTAIRAARVAANVAIKILLKEIAINGAFDLAARGAVEGFVRLITVEDTDADGGVKRQLRPWVVKSHAFLEDFTKWAKGQHAELLNKAFRSTDDLFLGLLVYTEYGPDAVPEALEIADEVEGDLRVALGPDLPPALLGHGLLLQSGAADALWLRLFFKLTGKNADTATQKLADTWALLVRGVRGVDLHDQKTRRGLERLTQLVNAGARNDEFPLLLAVRIRRSLRLLDDTSKAKFLQDFDDLYEMTKTNPDLLRKVQDLARDFAARGPRHSRAGRTKGAAYGVQGATDGLKATPKRLDPADASAIEPPAPNKDGRLFRDLYESVDGGRYVELKAWKDLGSERAVKSLKSQMWKHFKRLGPPGVPVDLRPVVIRTTAPVPPQKVKNKVIGAVVASLISQRGLDRQAALAWAFKNVQFEHVPLRYTFP